MLSEQNGGQIGQALSTWRPQPLSSSVVRHEALQQLRDAQLVRRAAPPRSAM